MADMLVTVLSVAQHSQCLSSSLGRINAAYAPEHVPVFVGGY